MYFAQHKDSLDKFGRPTEAFNKHKTPPQLSSFIGWETPKELNDRLTDGVEPGEPLKGSIIVGRLAKFEMITGEIRTASIGQIIASINNGTLHEQDQETLIKAAFRDEMSPAYSPNYDEIEAKKALEKIITFPRQGLGDRQYG